MECKIRAVGEITLRFEVEEIGEVKEIPDDVEQKILDYFMEIMVEEGIFDEVEIINSRISFSVDKESEYLVKEKDLSAATE